jgi:hypothetical protein
MGIVVTEQWFSLSMEISDELWGRAEGPIRFEEDKVSNPE